MPLRSAKRHLLLATFVALWIAALVPSDRAPSSPLLVERHFVRIGERAISVPGIDDRALERALADRFVLPRWLRTIGYDFQFRTSLHPTLDVATSPHMPNQPQLVLRGEVGDEFEGNRSSAVYERATQWIADTVRTEEQRGGIRVAVLLVPPKTLANELAIRHVRPDIHSREVLRISDDSRRVGTLTNFRRVAARLASLGVTTLPALEAVSRVARSQGGYPPYPFGESHWNRRTILAVAQAAALALGSRAIVPRRCIEDRALTDLERPVDTEPLEGDLFELAQLDASFGYGRRLVTQVPVDAPNLLDAASRDVTCPDLHLVGTSYSTVYEGHGDFGQALKAFYRGNVTNHGHAARTPDQNWGELDRDSVKPGSVVVWEVPFRYVKFLPRA